MDIIDRYLNAVAAQLPQDERADIVAELRDMILSRFEEREEALGRPLTEAEQEDILREIGHPLVVAARYRNGPDSLVGPEIFPYWLFGVKAGLLVLGAVHVLMLALNLIGGSADMGRTIAQAFHSFFGAGLTLIGGATVVAAIFEHYGVRPKWLTQWRARDLAAFGLSDPSAWGASMTASGTAKQTWTPARKAQPWPGAEHLFSLLALGVFVLWWVGLIHFPGFGLIELRGQDAVVTPAPVWSLLFGPILIYVIIQMSVNLNGLLQPGAVRGRAIAEAAIAVGGLWLTWFILEAGHWFTLTVGQDTARIAGDWTMLNLDTLRNLGEGSRDLVGVASMFSVLMVWILVISGISLVFKIFGSLVKLVKG